MSTTPSTEVGPATGGFGGSAVLSAAGPDEVPAANEG